MSEKIGLEAILEDANFQAGMSRYLSGVSQMDAQTATVAGRLGKQFLGLGNAVLGAGLLMGGTLVAGGVAAAGALTAVGVSGTRLAADLEEQMKGVQAVLGGTNEELAQLNDLVISLGINPNLKVTAVEAAGAIEMLARNGLNVQEILEGAAEATVLLANATGSTFDRAADIATDAMSVFGIEAGDMIEAVNGITSVVNNSKFTIDDYALALAQGGGVAAAVGVPFDEFNAAIAASAPLFASGSDAGTSFKTMLTRLNPVSEQAAGALADLGIITEESGNKFFDANGNLKSMAEVAGVLQDALGGLSEEQKTQALATIFGTDAMRAAVALAQVGEEGFAGLQATMAQTDAVEAAAIRMDNLRGAMEILSGVIETIKIKIGQALIPVVRNLVETVTGFISQHEDQITGFFAGLAQWLGENVPAAIATASGFLTGTLLPAVGEVVGLLQANLVPTFEKVRAFLAEALPVAIAFVNEHWEEFKGALIGIGVVLAAAGIAAGIAGIAAAIGTLLSPIGLVIGAAALIGAAWAGNWGGIQEKTQAVMAVVTPLLQSLWSWLQEKVPAALTTLRGFWQDTLLPALQAAWAFFNENIIPILADVWAWLQEKVPAALTTLRDFWQEILLPALQAAWAFFNENIVPILKEVAEIIELSLNIALTAMAGIWENVLQPALQTAWEWFNDKILPVLNDVWAFIKDKLGPVLDSFKSNTIDKLSGALAGLRDILQWVADKLASVKGALENLELPDWMTPGSPTPWEMGLRGVASALEQLVQTGLPGLDQQLNLVARGAPPFGQTGGFRQPIVNVQPVVMPAPVQVSGGTTVNNFNLTAPVEGGTALTLQQGFRLMELLRA